MKVIKAPEPFDDEIVRSVIIFLGGSIEMDTAEKWQDRLAEALKDQDSVTLLNPRRDDWDSSWVQDPTPGTKFHEQVTWELDGQDASDIIVYYFDPNTKAPITLLELGLYAGQNVVVCCPEGYWRKGNVEVVCDRHNIPLVESFDELVQVVEEMIEMIFEEEDE